MKAGADDSFVMVVWLESNGETAEPEWRWRVNHVRSGEQAYFRRLADVLAYINKKTGIAPPQ